MIQIKNYDLSKTYLIGVSGGPDSMALLDLLIKKKLNLVVCHCNYHTRSESDTEEVLVRDFCKKYNVKFEVHSCFYDESKGNFEAWARVERYTFFREMFEKYNAQGVFIAHHVDDLLETYLMQKQRGSIVSYFGLKEESNIFSIAVYRPLLKYSKEELVSYCEENKIPYSIDVTNLLDVHLRNRIRNQNLKNMSKEDKEKLIEEINKENAYYQEKLKQIDKFFSLERIDINEFLFLNEFQRQVIIFNLIVKKIPSLINKISYYRINELIRILFCSKASSQAQLNDEYYFSKEYDYFTIRKYEDNEDYSYILEEPGVLDTKEFSCDFSIDTSFLKITNDSYPLTFRNVKDGDEVKIGEQVKKVNRILIDEKIPYIHRKHYPVVLDKKGKIVYIPLFKSSRQKLIADKLKFVLK